MLCSLANDHSGSVYKIISITWDGFAKDCYLQKQGPGGESRPEDDKDVPERDLVPPNRPQEIPRELTPPPSDREWKGDCSDSGSHHGAPINIAGADTGGPVAYAGGNEHGQNVFLSPQSAYVEEDYDDDYESMPPLSPAMVERGMFPTDEEYYSGNSYHADNEDDYHSQDDGGYGAEVQGFVSLPPQPPDHQGFVPLGPQGNEGFVSLPPRDDLAFVALGQPHTYNSEHDSPGGRSERSGKKSHGLHKKKHKKVNSERSEKERESGKSKSKSKSDDKSRSRRNSTSSKDEKKEKKESSYRSERPKQTRKPSLFSLPKF